MTEAPTPADLAAQHRQEASEILAAQGFATHAAAVASLITNAEAEDRTAVAACLARCAVVDAATRILRDRPFAHARTLVGDVLALRPEPVKGDDTPIAANGKSEFEHLMSVAATAVAHLEGALADELERALAGVRRVGGA